MPTAPILVIAGTNRPNANALNIARILVGHYRRDQVPVELLSLADLPAELFQPQAYASKPPSFEPIQRRILESSGLHVVTPEYNGSFPGVLKYFIDMLQFPHSFENKPVAFVGEAAGAYGALRAVEQLQMIFGYRNAYLFPHRVFIPGVKDKLDANGKLIIPDLDERLARQARAFAGFIDSVCRQP